MDRKRWKLQAVGTLYKYIMEYISILAYICKVYSFCSSSSLLFSADNFASDLLQVFFCKLHKSQPQQSVHKHTLPSHKVSPSCPLLAPPSFSVLCFYLCKILYSTQGQQTNLENIPKDFAKYSCGVTLLSIVEYSVLCCLTCGVLPAHTHTDPLLYYHCQAVH